MHPAKAEPPRLQGVKTGDPVTRFNRTLFDALDALENSRLPYALIGGVASSGLGRPRSTNDIDLFVRAEDADAVLDALAKHGFKTERTDRNWLYKAFKEGILVDIIFKSRGDIYYDSDMDRRAVLTEYHGRRVRTVSPEDLMIIKCAVHDEVGPHHWHDALAVLSRASLDWDYLLKRGRRAQKRLLSLLLYAQSNDIWVPNRVVFDLFRTIYGEMPPVVHPPRFTPEPLAHLPRREPSPGRRVPDEYVLAHVREALAKDARGGHQDIRILIEGTRVLIRGEVFSEERRRAAEEIVRSAAEGFVIDNQIAVTPLLDPEAAEDVR